LDGRLCSLLGRSRNRKQSSRSKKGKYIILKRFFRRAKLFLLFNNDQQDKRHYIDDTNLQKNGIRHINWILKLHNEFCKYWVRGQINKDREDFYMEESYRKKKAYAKWREVTELDRDIKHETEKSVCPKLSSINSPNFRVCLYHQLNVVGRRSKLPSHLYPSPSNPNSWRGRGYKGRIHQDFERSKPIVMNKVGIIDYDGGCCDRERQVGPASRLDNKDIFALDI